MDGQLVWTASGPRGLAAAAAGDGDGDVMVMMMSCRDDNTGTWQRAYGEVEAIRETVDDSDTKSPIDLIKARKWLAVH